MPRRKARPELALLDLLDQLPERLQAPLGVVMGPSGQVADFLAARAEPSDLVYHMDLHQADQLRRQLEEVGAAAQVVLAPDLWDLDPPVRTLVYPAPERGERELKLDVIEQAYHALAPGGTLIVVSPYQKDQFFPTALKKVFGKVHVPPADTGTLFWCGRGADKPRRRHEITYQVQQPDGPSLRFVSRPGVFSYGRFDHGARALVETMHVQPGERIVDLGCGCGTNGVHAGVRSGSEGEVLFVDSNTRAVVLAELNAAANGLLRYRTAVSSRLNDLGEGDFDVALANPPYFAQLAIARLFIESARRLLRPAGRMYLVTKQPAEIGEIIVDNFSDAEAFLQRGYTVFEAANPKR